MPRKDGTGPQGQGSKTGKTRGKCSPQGDTLVPQGQDGIGTDRSQGRGSGRGAGRRQGQGSGRGAGQRSGRRK